MKKLIMTTVAAFGFAVCAKADVLNSTGFEDYDTLDSFKVNATDTGATEGHQYWTGDGSADFSQTVLKTYTEAGIAAPEENVPDAFTNAANTTFLSVDTGNAVMYRRAAANPTETINLSSAGPVFFDADVKFTASETAVVPSEGDKLLVWLKGDENSQTTNLVVTAGILDDRGVVTTNETFVTDAEVEADTWYRLTVKAGVDEKDCTYFNVYIDGKQVSATYKDGVIDSFPSLVESGSDSGKLIEAAGFQGTGALDNVVWTTTDPFPEVEPTTVDLTVALTDDDGVFYSLTAQVDDAVAAEVNVDNPAPIVADVDDVITFVAKVYAGYTPAVTGYDVDKSDDPIEIDEPDDGYAYTFTVTVTQAMIDDGLTLTINVTADGGEEPVVPETGTTPAGGGSATVKAADAEAAVEAVTVQGVNGTVYEASQKYYTKTAVGTDTAGVFEVTVELNETALDEDVDAAVEAALEAVKAGATSVALPAGFYYKVESGSALPIATTATGTADGSEIEVKGLTEAAGFFKVSVGTTNFAE